MVARRWLLGAGCATVLSACGFQLRRPPDFAFKSVYFAASESSPLAAELRRNLQSVEGMQVLTGVRPGEGVDVVLDLQPERRDKVVVGQSASGQVREFVLRTRVTFGLRTLAGRSLIASTELMQQRDFTFNESAALAKEAEEALLYRDIQADLVQQLMRRLAAVKAI